MQRLGLGLEFSLEDVLSPPPPTRHIYIVSFDYIPLLLTLLSFQMII